MTNNKKISVLMGVYNCSDTLAKSIESIIDQTYTNWELIICDDGSSDSTFVVASEWAKNDARIIVIRNNENRGLSYTLNRCLSIATGEYCARMDGDDICENTRFEKQFAFLEEHLEYGFVSSRMKRFDESGFYDIPEYIKSYAPTKKDFIKGSPYCHAPVMMRKSSYDAVNGYRDIPQTLGVEDYDLWFRLYSVGIYGYVLQEPLYSMFDGRDAAKRRTFRRRLNEAWVRKEGYRLIRVPVIFRIFIFKPIAIGLIPQRLYKMMKR
ncbi:MAG: glycosyltransferase [Saccharofermentans sp.]|nr:glycosyltransferase [Saccharofermentans sp.]